MSAPNRDEVIRLAKESNPYIGLVLAAHYGEFLQSFAALVAASVTRKQHIDALVGDALTGRKASEICERDGYAVTGVVLTLPDGRACIVNRSAVRWLHGKEDLFNLLHTDSGFNQRMINEAVAAELAKARQIVVDQSIAAAVAAEREACAKVCDALRDCEENTDGYRAGAGWCGEAIRARGSVQRCAACGYQHGHAIGCVNNPVDIEIRNMGSVSAIRARGEK